MQSLGEGKFLWVSAAAFWCETITTMNSRSLLLYYMGAWPDVQGAGSFRGQAGQSNARSTPKFLGVKTTGEVSDSPWGSLVG